MEQILIDSRQMISREVKSAIARAGVTQAKLAKALSISPGSLSEKINGRISFSFDDLLIVAGTLGLSLEELLGSSVTSTRVPEPAYVEEKGRKKVVPAGFIPTGTTYKMVAPHELSSVGPAGLEPATKGL